VWLGEHLEVLLILEGSIMARNLAVIGFVLLFCLTSSNQLVDAVQSTQGNTQSKKAIAEGRAIYRNYCASCHGVDATGKGPVSWALKNPPTDLTRIKREHGGFPSEKVRAIIAGDLDLPVHGVKEMPVWGGILKDQELTNLVKYIESIQRTYELPN
jgi:mono/diheme cytochrome c family protein